MRRATYRRNVTLLLMAGWLAWGMAVTWAERPEYQVKADFLPLFAQFVKWPATAFPDAQAPLVIGVLGDDPFGNALDQAVQKEDTVSGRKLVVKRSRRVEDLKTCHLLFISKSEKKQIAQILASLGDAVILTVSEFDGFAQRGGIINFFLQASKVRFEINVSAARRKELKIDVQLLSLGKIVGPQPGEENQ